jgi:LPS-assembly protein
VTGNLPTAGGGPGERLLAGRKKEGPATPAAEFASEVVSVARCASLALCCLTAFFPPGTAFGQVEGSPLWEITADRLTRHHRPEVYVAEGDVVLTRREEDGEPLVLEADWMRYDVDPAVVEAKGNITLHAPDLTIEAAETQLSLDARTATLKESTIMVPMEEYTLYITGRVIEKTGELTYRVERGSISSCPPREDSSRPWIIKSREVRIRRGGMAVVKHATLNVKDIPVLYTPYFIFPAKTERESGFLLPEISSSSRSGFGLIIPYFLDISPSSDLTFYPGYLEKRGVLAGIEGRYVADELSRGTFLATYQRDRTRDTSEDDFLSDGYLRTTGDRFWLRGKVDQYFSDSLVARLDYDLVSDRDFLQEFRGGLLGFNETNRQFQRTFNRGLQAETDHLRTSSLQLVKSWDNMLLGGELQGVQDLRDIPVAETPAQTLPRLQFGGRSLIARAPLSLAWDSEYVNFWREEGIGYQRADLHPRLTLPVSPWLVEGRLTGGIRHTSYLVQEYGDAFWLEERYQNRTLGTLEGDLATVMARDFTVSRKSGRSINHAFRPALNYNYLPSADQDHLPLIDGVDRLEPRNWLTYGLTNHFNLREGLGEVGGESRYLGYFRVSQTWDLSEDRRNLQDPTDQQRPLSDVLFELDLRPLERMRFNYESALSSYGQGFTYYKILSSYSDRRGHHLYVDYNYLKDAQATRPFFFNDQPTISEQRLTVGLEAPLTRTILLQGAHTEIWRTEGGREIRDLNQSARLLYHPTCWAVALQASRDREDTRIALVFSLTGIGDLLGIGLEGSSISYDLL